MDQDDLTRLAELQRLLDEAYQHYFQHSDGYCKSAEGSIELSYGTHFTRRDGQLEAPAITNVHVYSYVFSTGRSEDFDTLEDALETVREWHREELSTVYDDNGDPIERDGQPVAPFAL